jgi:tetratricopeptide (TPR) repeat protein
MATTGPTELLWCPCGSGLRFEHCCKNRQVGLRGARLRAPVGAPPAAGRTRRLRARAIESWNSGSTSEALLAFRQLAEIEANNPDAHNDLGLALAGVGRLQEAVESFDRALALRPAMTAAQENLASTYDQLGRETAAADAYRKLAELTANRVDRGCALARALQLEGQLDEATELLRDLISANPGGQRARVLLGLLLLDRGEFAEAESLLVQAIDDFPDVFQHLAASRRMREDDRPLIDRMIAGVESVRLTELQRASIQFGLGKAFDDLGDYEKAMSWYDAANASRQAASRLDRQGLLAHYEGLTRHYAEAAGGVRASGEGDPQSDLAVLIVGMPRSGTTLIEQILSAHPAVAAGGELPFWSEKTSEWLSGAQGFNGPAPDVQNSVAMAPAPPVAQRAALATLAQLAQRAKPDAARTLRQQGRDYISVLRGIGPTARRVTDKSPYNFERLGQILTALPKARIIHCRRHPVDTCLSMYFANFKGRQAWSKADIAFQYQQYRRLMAHWRDVLPSDSLLEIDYEDVVQDREAVTRRLLAFCGLEWDDACLAPEQNRRAVRTASLWQARQPIYRTSLARWRNYAPWLGAFQELTALPNP